MSFWPKKAFRKKIDFSMAFTTKCVDSAMFEGETKTLFCGEKPSNTAVHCIVMPHPKSKLFYL